ncbi:MAG: energy transducer TonB [Saprospiraceae bacterium]
MKTPLMFLLFSCLSVSIAVAQNVEPNFDGAGVKGHQPMFSGCEEMDNIKERRKCAEQKMMQFLYGNIKYPDEAREDGIEGVVVIKFFVDEDGSIWDAEVARDIGGGCGMEALRVVESMPDWNPGTIDGNPVGMHVHLPVKFSLGKRNK